MWWRISGRGNVSDVSLAALSVLVHDQGHKRSPRYLHFAILVGNSGKVGNLDLNIQGNRRLVDNGQITRLYMGYYQINLLDGN